MGQTQGRGGGQHTDDEARDARAVVADLREPFFLNVLKARRGVDGKADQEDVGLRVGQGAQTIVVLLTRGIEQSKSVRLIADPR